MKDRKTTIMNTVKKYSDYLFNGWFSGDNIHDYQHQHHSLFFVVFVF